MKVMMMRVSGDDRDTQTAWHTHSQCDQYISQSMSAIDMSIRVVLSHRACDFRTNVLRALCKKTQIYVTHHKGTFCCTDYLCAV